MINMSIWVVLADIMAISIIVDWITQLFTEKDYGCLSYLIISIALYYIWWIIATGGIIR